MFSSRFLFLSLVVAVGFGGVGCNRLHWGEKPADSATKPTQLGSEVRCLSNVLPVMKDFIKGEAQAAQVSRSWQCFASALQLFKNRVRGENPKGYKAQELRDFFELYFLKEGVQISDGLLTQIMRLKQVFVGGENQLVTRAELEDLIRFAGEMESHSLELLPSMKILALKWQMAEPLESTSNEADFELAKLRAEKVLALLAGRIESRGASYEIENIITLLEELQALYSANWEFLVSLKKGLPLFQKLKKTLMGTDQNLVLANEWRRFGLLGVRSYLLFLRYHYFVKQAPKGNSAGPDYKTAFKSLDDLLMTAGEFIAQKPGGRLEVAEMQEVVDQAQALFPDLSVSPQLLPELMKVKQSLVGGSEAEFTLTDFESARKKLGSFRTVAELYSRWSKVLTGQWDPASQSRDLALQEFSQAEADLIRISISLGGVFESSYDLRSLLNLLKALEVTFPAREQTRPVSEVVAQYLEVGVSVKSLILNDWKSGKRQGQLVGESVIQQNQWLPLFESSAEVYGKYLFFNYFLKGRDWRWGHDLRETQALVQSLRAPMLKVLKARGEGSPVGITSLELGTVFQEAQKAKLTELTWSSSVVTELLDRVFRRFLSDPADRLQGRSETTFSEKALEVLLAEVDLLLDLQSRMSQLVQVKPTWEQAELRTALADTEFSRLLQGSATFGLDPKGRIFISPKSSKAYDQESLFRMNWVRGLVRLVMRSYCEDETRVAGLGPLTEPEVEKIFADFKPIAVELGLIDSKNVKFAKNRFVEANLFTPNSDGDQTLEYRETVWLISYITSGLTIHKSLRPDYEKDCGKAVSIEADCALRVFQNNISTQLVSMPQMSKYLSSVEPLDRREMIRYMFTAAGWSPNQRKILMTDVALIPHVTQYLESLIRRFDSDNNGNLNMNEAMRAEFLFRPMLMKVSGFDDEVWLKALFAYILVYGQAPESVTDELFFVSDWVNRDQFPINADRKQLAKIMAFIAERARQPTDR